MNAFPTPAHNLQNDGMTLRDYFAAKAMQAMVANADCFIDPITEVPNAAFKIADAMMEARNAAQ